MVLAAEETLAAAKSLGDHLSHLLAAAAEDPAVAQATTSLAGTAPSTMTTSNDAGLPPFVSLYFVSLYVAVHVLSLACRAHRAVISVRPQIGEYWPPISDII